MAAVSETRLQTASPPPPRAARLTIDPGAVVRNWQALTRMSEAECGAVVKANAYGLGIEVVAPALWRAGCGTFFVALAAEGHDLRAVLPEATIYVMNGVFEDVPEALAARLIPFISSVEALAEWPDAPYCLNVDTTKNRLGLTVPEAMAVDASPHLIASHFASADTPSHPQNAIQEAAFKAVRAHFAHVPASFANSAALLTRPQSHYDLTRPGIALYGGVAAHGVPPLEPTVRLEARVIQVREAEAGQTVGYGAAETLTRPSRIAIASVGYADGYLRAAGGADRAPGAPAFVNGVMTRLLGRVSMDLVAVDVTDARCVRGDYIELFGTNVPLQIVAEKAGTIGYEMLTGLSRRAARYYGTL
ncbi:MAG: alanine racemase [Devosia sp.]